MVKIKSKKLNMNGYNWGKLGVELIVVFLGVTAGFVLNNWSLQKKEAKNENKYILGFIKDVNNNIIELENFIESDSIWFINANPVLKSLENKEIELDSAKVAIELIAKIKRAKKYTDTYENITNSDNLSIISDFNLKSQIISYHNSIKSVERFDDFFYEYFNDFVMPVLFSEYNLLHKTFDDPNIIRTTKFYNVFVFYYSFMQQQKDGYDELLDKSYKLVDELNEYKMSEDI